MAKGVDKCSACFTSCTHCVKKAVKPGLSPAKAERKEMKAIMAGEHSRQALQDQLDNHTGIKRMLKRAGAAAATQQTAVPS